jgi:hypothetical protein
MLLIHLSEFVYRYFWLLPVVSAKRYIKDFGQATVEVDFFNFLKIMFFIID